MGPGFVAFAAPRDDIPPARFVTTRRPPNRRAPARWAAMTPGGAAAGQTCKSVSAEPAGNTCHLYGTVSNSAGLRAAVARQGRSGRTGRMWNVHVNLQSRNRRTAIDPHPDVFPFDGDLPGDGCENLLLQN